MVLAKQGSTGKPPTGGSVWKERVFARSNNHLGVFPGSDVALEIMLFPVQRFIRWAVFYYRAGAPRVDDACRNSEEGAKIFRHLSL